jgi:hypothetical protein
MVNKKAFRRAFIYIAGAIAVAVVVVVYVSIIFFSIWHPNDKPYNYSKGIPFNKEDWIRKDVYYYNRKYVIKDLMENHLHRGMHYKKVTDLLGDTQPYFPRGGDSAVFVLSYEIEVLHQWTDIDPYKTVSLHISFSAKDSLLIDSEITK